MALGSTIFKATVQIADLNRHYYADHQLTLARHPSETDERLMIRLLSFLLHVDERLKFTKGLCADDEPDLWQHSLSGDIELWIDVGLPDERRVRKACSRAERVVLCLYGGRTADLWWQKNAEPLQRFTNLEIINIAAKESKALAGLARRNMRLNCTIQDGSLWLSDDSNSLSLTPQHLKETQ